MPSSGLRRTLAIFGVLRDREIRALWLSQWISDSGSFVTFVALAVYIHSLTRAAVAVGFALSLRSIAGFVFGPFSGVLADRWDRRRVLIVCDLTRATLVATLPFTKTAWQAYAIAFAAAAVSPLFRAARTGFVAEIAAGPKLVPALTVDETTHHALHMIGPAIGGLLVLLLGARRAFFVDAASFVASAAILSTIASRGRPSAVRHSPLREFREGVATLVRAPAVRTYSLLNAAIALSGAGIMALLVLYVRDDLGLRGGYYGLVLAMAGLGTISATLAIAAGDERRHRTPWAFLSALSGSAFVLALFHPTLAPLLVMGFAWGLQDGGIDLPFSATAAETIPNQFRGRVAAADEGFGEIAWATGSLFFPWLETQTPLDVAGALATAAAIGTALSLVVLAAGGARAIAHRERLRVRDLPESALVR